MNLDSLLEKLPVDKLPQGLQDQVGEIKAKVSSGELSLEDAKTKIDQLVGSVDIEAMKDKIPGNIDDSLIDKAKGFFGK